MRIPADPVSVRHNEAGDLLSLRLLTSPAPTKYKTIAELLQKQWAELGVHLSIDIPRTQGNLRSDSSPATMTSFSSANRFWIIWTASRTGTAAASRNSPGDARISGVTRITCRIFLLQGRRTPGNDSTHEVREGAPRRPQGTPGDFKTGCSRHLPLCADLHLRAPAKYLGSGSGYALAAQRPAAFAPELVREAGQSL